MVELRKITYDNFDECVKLKPNEDQRNFVAPNVNSLAEAYVALVNDECIPMPYAIYSDDTMVGFIMLAYSKANESTAENTYWIWRFMVDKQYQGKGYGRKTMGKVLELIKTFPHGKASSIQLSYEPENIVAKTLYASFGFKETGEIEDGELVARLTLSSET